MKQASVTEVFQGCIADPVIRFVMASRSDVTAVFLQVTVDFPQPFRPIDDGKEPAGPAQGVVLVHLEQFPVETADQLSYRLFRFYALP